MLQLKTNRSKGLWIAWILVLPVVLIRAFTTIYPTFETFKISFFDVRLLKGIDQFAGFNNYINIFKDPKILATVEFTIIFVVVSMIFHIILGVILALILNMKFKGRRLLRTIVLIPWAMPMVVIGMAAKWAFNNEYGMINDLIRRFIPTFQLDWLIEQVPARIAVIGMDLWKDLPFFAILVLAGLQFISNELYEASTMDGAGSIRSFFYITLPLITKNLLTLSIFFTMWRLVTFDIVYTMTTGGPGEDTALIAYRITMEAFTNLNLGYGATLAVLLFIIMSLFSSISLWLIKRIDY